MALLCREESQTVFRSPIRRSGPNSLFTEGGGDSFARSHTHVRRSGSDVGFHGLVSKTFFPLAGSTGMAAMVGWLRSVLLFSPLSFATWSVFLPKSFLRVLEPCEETVKDLTSTEVAAYFPPTKCRWLLTKEIVCSRLTKIGLWPFSRFRWREFRSRLKQTRKIEGQKTHARVLRSRVTHVPSFLLN